LTVPLLTFVPSSVREELSLTVTVPALLRFVGPCPPLTVDDCPPPMLATSAAPGTLPHDQFAAVPQLPVAGFQVQVSASA
jgi:hypothetical protein